MDERLKTNIERHAKIAMALTEYDRKQATKPGYNRYALPLYFQALDRVEDDLASGTEFRAALVAAFTGKLLACVLRAVGEPPPSIEELRG